MGNMRSPRSFIATVLCIYVCLTPLEVEGGNNRYRPDRPTFNRGPPNPQQQMGPNLQQQHMGPNPQQQMGPQSQQQMGQPGNQRPQWPPKEPQQPMNVHAKIPNPNSNWVPKPLRPSSIDNPFLPEQSPPLPETNSFQKPALKTFESFNEVPVDEKSPDVVKTDEKILDAVDKLSEEIVEAVVERLEEDEALAIELEREGFDPNAPSAAIQTSRTTIPILPLVLAICAF